MKLLKKSAIALLEIRERPERTALAFALGIFLGFSPLLGLHTILGLLLAIWLRLNKFAVLVGVYANNPWIIVPYYAACTWLGVTLTGAEYAFSPPTISFYEFFSAAFWQWLSQQWRLLAPAFLGSFIGSTLLALISYPLSLFFLRRFARSQPSPVAVKGELMESRS